MTPKHPILTMPNGEVFEVVGVSRPAKDDVWLSERLTILRGAGALGCRPILKPIPPTEPSEGGIQRRGDYEQPCGESSVFDPDVDDLIDAACAVVNCPGYDAMALDDGFTAKAIDTESVQITNLAAALQPFTEPTPQPERYYVEDGRVFDRRGTLRAVGIFHTEDDAKDFAAMKNGKVGV